MTTIFGVGLANGVVGHEQGFYLGETWQL